MNTELEYNYGKEHCLMMIDEGINDEVETIMLEPRCLYDDAVVGYTDEGSAVYGIGKILGALIKDISTDSDGLLADDRSQEEVYEDAMDYLNYNILGGLEKNEEGYNKTVETLEEDGKEITVAYPILINQ
jgi:hypothetical protein